MDFAKAQIIPSMVNSAECDPVLAQIGVEAPSRILFLEITIYV